MIRRLFVLGFISLLSLPLRAEMGGIITFPDGSDGSIQFSSAGYFTSDPQLIFSTETNKLSVSSASVTWAQISTAAVNKIIWADGTTSTTSTSGGGSGTDATKLPLDGSANMTGQLTSTTGTFTGSYFSVGTSTFVVKEGKVGIGTTAPGYMLDLLGPSITAPYQTFRIGVRTTDIEDNSSLILQSTSTDDSMSLTYFGPNNVTLAGWGMLNLSASSPGFLMQTGGGFNFSFTNTGFVGMGTTAPSYNLHVSTGASTTATIFAVSSGTVDLFAVHGTSVSLEVPLVFPDGTTQVTANSGGSGGGDNFGSHTATQNVVMANFAITGISSATANLFYGSAANMTSIPGPQVTGLVPSSVIPSTYSVTIATEIVSAGKVHTSFFTVRSSTMQITAAAGANVNTPMFAVSTGPVNVFSVQGGSVSLKVPLVFPDGTIQTTADTGAGAGGGFNTNPTTVTINLGGTYSVINATDVVTEKVTVNGTGAGTFEITSTTGSIGTTGNPQAFGILGASSVAFNNGQIIAQSTMVTVNQNFRSSGTITAVGFSGSGASLTSLTAANIASGSLGSSVLTSSVAASSVNTLQIADNAVTGAKIAAATITGADVDASSFTMVGPTVDASEIAAGTLGTGVIAQTIPQSDDPDVSASGQISKDTDGWLRVYDGSAQKGKPVIEIFHVSASTPNAMPDANRDAQYFFTNVSSMAFVVQGWTALSDTDDTSLAIEECDFDGGNSATVDAVEIATNGTGLYYATDTTITAATVEATHRLRIDYDDADFPGLVQITIWGYYDADVN